MTQTEERIENLNEVIKNKIVNDFISTSLFYETVYLVIQNGHVLQQNQPEMWEKKLESIQFYQNLIEKKISEYGLDGKELVADIASDYFEDFVNYRTREMKIESSQFFQIIKGLN